MRLGGWTLTVGAVVAVVAAIAAVGCSTFSSTATATNDDAGSDGASAEGGHVLPAGTLDDFEQPAAIGCGAMWQATDSDDALVPGAGIDGSQACRICANITGFVGMQTGTIVDASAGTTYSVEVSASYQTRQDAGPTVFVQVHGSGTTASNGGGILPADAGTWKSGTSTLIVDKDEPLFVSISMGGTVPGDCILVDNVKFIKR